MPIFPSAKGIADKLELALVDDLNEIVEQATEIGPILTMQYDALLNPVDVLNQFRLTMAGFDVNGSEPLDNGYHFGINVNYGGGRADTNYPALFDSWESLFYIGSPPGTGIPVMERHIQHTGMDDVLTRPFSIAVPVNGAVDKVGGSGMLIQTEALIISDYAGAIKLQGVWNTDTLFVSASVKVWFASNNIAVCRMQNAAGNAFLPLPFINSQDALAISQPLSVQDGGISPPNGVAFEFNSSAAMADGNGFMSIQSSVFHGNISLLVINGSNNCQGQTVVRNANNNNSSSFAQSVFEAFVGGSSAGNAYFRATNNVNNWSFGLRNDDSDALYITPDYWLNLFGGTPAIRIDVTTKQCRFYAPAKLESYTVATLPSASTFGKGSLLYVTDETGGEVPAFSDGTNWRRVTDRAVIS